MILSNRLPIALLFFAISLLSACGGTGSGNSQARPTPAPTPADLPFTVREPERFRADFIITAGGVETRRTFYRDGDRWRLVTYGAEGPSREVIHNGNDVLIDHERRVFSEAEAKTGFPQDFVQEATIRALREREYTDYEDLGLEGGLRRYRAALRLTEGPSAVIFYDEELKMITRQEFFSAGSEGPELVFEMRDLSLDVSDEMFRIPDDYRKISEKEFYSPKK
jgi:hypothetical protein